MAADLHPKTPPSPEFIAILTWLTQNLWAAVSFLIVLLGRVVFGNIKEQMKESADQNALQNAQQNQKLDLIIDKFNSLSREVSEIKGELKGKGRSTK